MFFTLLLRCQLFVMISTTSTLPIIRRAPGNATDDPGGKITTVDPGQDNESGIADDQVQVALPLLRCPAHKPITVSGQARKFGITSSLYILQGVKPA